MPSAVSPNPRVASDALDDLDQDFNYDAAVDEFLQDLPIKDAPHDYTSTNPPKDIDEEITVKKKRKSVPKLDDERLLSQNGIPRLRKITKSRLKFRGKGYEFSDISRLLNTYQLWLDDLFPKAKFRDALSIVEKLGHSKKMQVMRKAWLDETKPHARDEEPEDNDDIFMSGALSADVANGQARNHGADDNDVIFGTEVGSTNLDSTQKASRSDDAPDDDELDSLLAETVPGGNWRSIERLNKGGPFSEDSDEDELDALLAQESSTLKKSAAGSEATVAVEARAQNAANDDFADEEDVMRDMGMW